MLQAKSIVQKKNKNNPYLFVNLIFSFFPISFVLGSLIVNVNLLLMCCLGIYHLKSKILKTKFDFPIKIIFLFFLIIFFSTSLSVAKALYFGGYDSFYLERLTKSILFFRFFLFLIIIYLLSKFNILHFKYFFLTAAFTSVLISLDIIYQYIFGFNIIGLKKGPNFSNAGFFGDEYIAGGFIQRFSFFAIFLTIFTLKNKNYTKFISTVIVICILTAGILFAGNRMPLILFTFGLCLVFLLNLKIKKILFVSCVVMFILLKFIISSNEPYKTYLAGSYGTFPFYFKNIISKTWGFGINKWHKTERWDWEHSRKGQQEPEKEKFLGQKTHFYEAVYESFHRRIFVTAFETWGANKIFGNGIKSFQRDCWKLGEQPNINLGEDLYPDKKNLLCSAHPHNYYLQILTETGIVGLFIVSVIALLFIVFIFKNFKFVKQINIENLILLSAIISLILETLPLKSTGSLFTTNNATYLTLISSIVLSHKTLIKIKNFR